MNAHPFPHRARLTTYLAAGYALFIVYGSLSPFAGWHDQGFSFLDVLTAPLSQTYTGFDTVVNLLAYFPFGLLLGLALRTRFGAGWSALIATLGGITLSATMEYAQMYLPTRVSSNLDLLNNGISTLAGATLAAGIAPQAWFVLRLTYWRLRLFHTHSSRDFGLALVALWIFAQANPSLPMLGNVFITGVTRQIFEAAHDKPFSWTGSMAVAFNLLMLGMLLLILLRQRRHMVSVLLMVICVVALAKFIAAAILLKSWALLLWLNSEAVLGIFAGALLLVTVAWLPYAWLVRAAALTAMTHLLMTHWVLDSNAPAAAMRLYQWRYVHLLNYNGLSQTVAMVFPFLLLGYLWRVRNWHGRAV